MIGNTYGNPEDDASVQQARLVAGGIGHALDVLRRGGRVAREGWNGKGQYLGLQRPDANSANTLPYVYIVTVSGDRVPWLCSQTDLLATDWFEF